MYLTGFCYFLLRSWPASWRRSVCQQNQSLKANNVQKRALQFDKGIVKKSWNHVKVTGVFQSVQVADEGRGDSGAKTGACKWACLSCFRTESWATLNRSVLTESVVLHSLGSFSSYQLCDVSKLITMVFAAMRQDRLHLEFSFSLHYCILSAQWTPHTHTHVSEYLSHVHIINSLIRPEQRLS